MPSEVAAQNILAKTAAHVCELLSNACLLPFCVPKQVIWSWSATAPPKSLPVVSLLCQFLPFPWSSRENEKAKKKAAKPETRVRGGSKQRRPQTPTHVSDCSAVCLVCLCAPKHKQSGHPLHQSSLVDCACQVICVVETETESPCTPHQPELL